MLKILTKLLGTKNERELKKLQANVDLINLWEDKINILSDEDLKGKTAEFKGRIEQGATLEDILIEAFAVVREAGKRVLNMRHYDVQMIGGMVLNSGKISEMKTGEGKTLVATLPAYLNALTGKGVHVITVNDYLAKRDSEWMGKLYQFLGLKVGLIQHHMGDLERKIAYASDITYGTNNEFGFDYLRDNMKYSLGSYVQRDLNYAIVDEVDSILIDEARTPLIISGPSEDSTDKYYNINIIIPRLTKDTDYQIDEKHNSVALTEGGVTHVEKLLSVENLYEPSNIEILHHVNQALKAHTLFKKDVDYVVNDGEVIIVDEFTGRLMPGRRYSEGLHQALEAKEGVKIESENQTLATITFQNYFRMYEKLAGMTGTADTEAEEFNSIYKLEVIAIPTNKPLRRTSHPDLIYRTEKEKYKAVVDEIVETNKIGRPSLVGTISIENSEKLSAMLKRHGIKHHVLNAKNHEREAEIVADAGQMSAVTIATNMAGRGTDIVLGEGVSAIGGLHIIGTERHESRRIDNQLRGRAGRQGDPGSSKFFLSLEDDLLRIFGSDRISTIMEKLGMEEGEPVEHKFITKAIENAQKRVEGHNFDIRKHLLEYDDVMNKQREVIYAQRREILEGKSLKEEILGMFEDVIKNIIASHINSEHYDDFDKKALGDTLKSRFGIDISIENDTIKIYDKRSVKIDNKIMDNLENALTEEIKAAYDEKERTMGNEGMRQLERMLMLQVVDARWKEHLLSMDHLKEGIGLRGYGHKDPLNEYKKEGFDMFTQMIFTIKEEITSFIARVHIENREEPQKNEAPQQHKTTRPEYSKPEPPKSQEAKPIHPSLFMKQPQQRTIEHRGNIQAAQHTPVTHTDKVGRNENCSCGSGKKYKKCCGR